MVSPPSHSKKIIYYIETFRTTCDATRSVTRFPLSERYLLRWIVRSDAIPCTVVVVVVVVLKIVSRSVVHNIWTREPAGSPFPPEVQMVLAVINLILVSPIKRIISARTHTASARSRLEMASAVVTRPPGDVVLSDALLMVSIHR